jgi:hypothetical protein
VIIFVVLDADGNECIPGITIDGVLLPLVGADAERVSDLKQLAAEAPALHGQKITVLRFGHREQIGEIDRTND